MEKTLGQRIKELRQERNMTIADVSRLTGLATGGLGDIERGKSGNPGIFTMDKIARALGVSVEYFLRTEKGIDNQTKYILKSENMQFLKDSNFQSYFEAAQRAYMMGVSPQALVQFVEILYAQRGQEE